MARPPEPTHLHPLPQACGLTLLLASQSLSSCVQSCPFYSPQQAACPVTGGPTGHTEPASAQPGEAACPADAASLTPSPSPLVPPDAFLH